MRVLLGPTLDVIQVGSLMGRYMCSGERKKPYGTKLCATLCSLTYIRFYEGAVSREEWKQAKPALT